VPHGAVTHAFPTPATLASADPAVLPVPRSRGAAVVAVATALASGDLDLHGDPDAAEVALLAIPGVGPWTAAVIRLRSMGDRDAFPAADLGLRRAFERLGMDARTALTTAERWRPLRAYAAQHLWAS
jgi:AraC family transcriptional regulator of adaptative response / DNA-3-methyladenine glycosylase II